MGRQTCRVDEKLRHACNRFCRNLESCYQSRGRLNGENVVCPLHHQVLHTFSLQKNHKSYCLELSQFSPKSCSLRKERLRDLFERKTSVFFCAHLFPVDEPGQVGRWPGSVARTSDVEHVTLAVSQLLIMTTDLWPTLRKTYHLQPGTASLHGKVGRFNHLATGQNERWMDF